MALAPILGGIASAGAAFGLNKLFASNQGLAGAPTPVAPVTPSGINAGGLTSSFSGNNLTITPTAERLAAIQSIQDVLGGQSAEIGGLRGLVAPGMSALRAARMAEIEDARNRSIGNLRDNLARRRVLGSSFGQDAISRGEAEFAGLRDRTAAETFLQELQMTHGLINEQFQLDRAKFQTALDDMNLQADVATKLSAKSTETLQKHSQFMAELASKEAAGRGAFFGTLSQPIVSGIGKGVESFFAPPKTA